MTRLLTLLMLFASSGLAGEAVGSWSGRRMVETTVRVIAADNGGPVEAASVWLLTGSDSVAYRAVRERPEAVKLLKPIEAYGSRVLTGPEGEASAFTYFDAAGGITIENGEQRYDGSWTVQGDIRVEKQGYITTISEVEALVSERHFSTSLTTLRLVIRLKKEPNQSPQPMPLKRHG